MKLEKAAESKFDSKPVQMLKNDSKLKFIGCFIGNKSNMLTISHQKHILKLAKRVSQMFKKITIYGLTKIAHISLRFSDQMQHTVFLIICSSSTQLHKNKKPQQDYREI